MGMRSRRYILAFIPKIRHYCDPSQRKVVEPIYEDPHVQEYSEHSSLYTLEKD